MEYEALVKFFLALLGPNVYEKHSPKKSQIVKPHFVKNTIYLFL